jgi:hypothetical protein
MAAFPDKPDPDILGVQLLEANHNHTVRADKERSFSWNLFYLLCNFEHNSEEGELADVSTVDEGSKFIKRVPEAYFFIARCF